MDYYPYGDIWLDEKAGSFSEQRKYAGHEYDTDTGLSYMNARYYSGKTGRFVSQDQVFLSVNSSDPFKLLTYLSNPQNLNSYSYALNNPLVLFDSDGNFPVSFQEFRSNINTALTFIKSAANGAWNHAKESYNNASWSSPQFGSKEYSQKMNEGLNQGGVYLGTKPNGQDVYFGITPGTLENVGIKSVLRGAQNPVVKNALKEGQIQHSLYKINEVSDTLKKEFRFVNGLKADAIDLRNKIIYELKPENNRAIQRGLNQLNKYIEIAEKQFGGTFKGVLDTYKKIK